MAATFAWRAAGAARFGRLSGARVFGPQRIVPQSLGEGSSQIDFVFLDVDQATLMERLGERKDHFFPKELLESQFATLERPADAIVVDARRPLEDVVEQIVSALT